MAACVRMARQTSTPEIPGIMRSVTTKSGDHSRKICRPSSGSLAVRTSYACAESAARSTRVICGSSSMIRILPGMRFLFLGKITSSGWAGMMHGVRNMGAHVYSRKAIRGGAATAMAMAATFVMLWFGANSTSAGMVFLVLVVWSSTQAGIGLSLYEAVLCAILFDYYFLPPIHSLRLIGVQAWVAMASFLVSSLVV